MEFLKQVLKGVVIGVANIIPGVSGGTMMVSMGIYDLLIHSITHLFKQFGKSIRTLLPYFIGMIVGIVALASLLKQLFAVYPLPTYTCFIGLILGGLGLCQGGQKEDRPRRHSGLCTVLRTGGVDGLDE